ncbi:hypothetical protein GCM10027280_58310 [Micromonospora polyrhachis]|uniref:Uncharacterized protein n=1 Tax=Micromonospora polyrhachis TaxID=1282883 RepID=A0A7W7WMN4_9ACTN|nr:hypothetical protein [Micromonospora polyrhachis]MBB4956644.1 hypothetical protein [Micromonospora polyrhachis]
MQSTDLVRVVSIVDAPDDVQQWVDALVEAARVGEGDFPHPHPDPPSRVLTLADLLHAIERAYSVGGVPWSIVERGFPPIDGMAATDVTVVIERTAAPATIKHDDDPVRPNSGTSAHNLLHSMLGDFH